jgi:hypothetical protein
MCRVREDVAYIECFVTYLVCIIPFSIELFPAVYPETGVTSVDDVINQFMSHVWWRTQTPAINTDVRIPIPLCDTRAIIQVDSSCNASDLHLGGAWFKSCLGQHVFMVFLQLLQACTQTVA